MKRTKVLGLVASAAALTALSFGGWLGGGAGPDPQVETIRPAGDHRRGEPSDHEWSERRRRPGEAPIDRARTQDQIEGLMLAFVRHDLSADLAPPFGQLDGADLREILAPGGGECPR